MRLLFGDGEGTRELDPAGEQAILRIGRKLDQLSDAELEAFRARTTGSSDDLAAVEAGVDSFLGEMQRLQRAGAEREGAKLRLFGLDAVYDRYRAYRSLLLSSATIGAFGMSDPRMAGTSLGMQPALSRMRDELTATLQRYGFASIDGFEQSIRELEIAFQTETVLIARDMLDRYEHTLEEQERQYGSAAGAGELHQQLTPARQHFQTATRIRDEHARMPMTPGEMEDQLYWSGQFRREQAQGRDAVRALSPAHPLLGDQDIPGGRPAMMLRQVAERRQAMQQTRRNIEQTPELVFELDELVRISCARQGIAPGSLYRRILDDHVQDAAIERAVINLAVAVIAIAAGLLTGGGGTVAVLAGATSIGIGAYQTYEEFRRYETLHAAHDAQPRSMAPATRSCAPCSFPAWRSSRGWCMPSISAPGAASSSSICSCARARPSTSSATSRASRPRISPASRPPTPRP